MPGPDREHPSETVARACARWGEADVVRRCAGLIDGVADPEFVSALSTHTEAWKAKPVNHYWFRVWGARSLLYAWDDSAERAVVAGLDDEHWRVREMCAKVAALRLIGASADPAAQLVADEVPRVRAAALRVLGAVGEGEHAPTVLDALDDEESAVRAAAQRALRDLERRLDRDLGDVAP
ncbi:HEAT repeat domain-containing protein [Luteipulveratus mongoliensis]|uniref:HEAT repeat-containing protein n=1 Tax=Luteipulveratus mongoliensis TaxID=571913 RepID=A0A0K1JHE0_9MICO|nr:HEAT repeat domain-containing protein [Luteipulveratus mongoliensis]AKU16005.1 hypothetical protein VV02_09300 [Luteipulveratus mongoliensis]